jgi:hypothetical protein
MNSAEGGDSIRRPIASPYSQPKKLAMIDTTHPHTITRPMSACSSATAASGPGVGGTIACVSCIAPMSPVLITPMLTPLRIAAECTSGLRIT